jgi:hypothetical protein
MAFSNTSSAPYAPRPSAMAKPRSGNVAPIAVAMCCFVIVAALVGGVGIPDHLVLRHLVQTLPLWAAVMLGFRRSRTTGWVALPFFLLWLVLMTLIWLYLLGIAHVLSGHFSPLEIAMTIVVGAASLIGIVAVARSESGTPPLAASIVLIVLYLVGITHVFSGRFSPLEMVIAIAVGTALLIGIVAVARSKSGAPPLAATTLFIIFAVIQWVCLRASLPPYIANR